MVQPAEDLQQLWIWLHQDSLLLVASKHGWSNHGTLAVALNKTVVCRKRDASEEISLLSL